VFIAVGGIRGDSGEIETGIIHTSENLEEWSPTFEGGKVTSDFTHGNDNLIRGLTYENGTFFAVGNKGIGVLISEDAKSWQPVVEEPTGPGGFCIASTEGKILVPTANQLHFSTDGETWESTNQHPELQERHGVGAWGSDGAGHVRKVVGENGIFVFAGERRFGSTADGKTFLFHEILPPGEKQGAYYLLAGNGRFLYLNEKGHRTSTDGVNWEPLVIDSEDPEVVKEQTSGVWTGEAFYVEGDGAVYRSEDGLDWEKIAVEKGSPGIHTAGNGMLVGKAHRAWQISTDGGQTWQLQKHEVPARQIFFFDGESVIGSGGG